MQKELRTFTSLSIGSTLESCRKAARTRAAPVISCQKLSTTSSPIFKGTEKSLNLIRWTMCRRKKQRTAANWTTFRQQTKTATAYHQQFERQPTKIATNRLVDLADPLPDTAGEGLGIKQPKRQVRHRRTTHTSFKPHLVEHLLAEFRCTVHRLLKQIN